jgi:hypothetical protein
MQSRNLFSRLVVPLLAATAIVGVARPAFADGGVYALGAVTQVSTCAGQNAEVEQAVDVRRGYVYEAWMGCKGIAFARSTDGGRSFGAPRSVPGSVGSNFNVWDPAVAVASDGTVYVAFMREGEPVVSGGGSVVQPWRVVHAGVRAHPAGCEELGRPRLHRGRPARHRLCDVGLRS